MVNASTAIASGSLCQETNLPHFLLILDAKRSISNLRNFLLIRSKAQSTSSHSVSPGNALDSLSASVLSADLIYDEKSRYVVLRTIPISPYIIC